MNYRIDPIFPSPIYKSNLTITKEILDFCFSNSKSWNLSNKLSNNKEILNESKLKNVKNFIEEHLQNYLKQVWDPNTEVVAFLTQSWLNFSYPGDSHHSHTHSNAFISGVYYINILPDDKLNFDRENFYMKLYPINSNIYNCHRTSVFVNAGDLLLFPPNLIHGTDKNNTEKEVRISLAFNAFIKGKIGSVENLTYLEI